MPSINTEIEIHFKSTLIKWCRYDPRDSNLLVVLRSNALIAYRDVPSNIVEAFHVSDSPGRFFFRHIIGQYTQTKPKWLDLRPRGRHGNTAALAMRSYQAVERFIPENSLEKVKRLLASVPVLIRVVKNRKSKHGDHLVSRNRAYSHITVSESKNPYQFLFTLLHEVAHACAQGNARRRIKPHGAEWKLEFGRLLLEYVHLFPENLQNLIRTHAQNPKYATYVDTQLDLGLKKFDSSTDLRMLVCELALGQYFSLDGILILKKGNLLRRRYSCHDIKGNRYFVSPTARVLPIDGDVPWE